MTRSEAFYFSTSSLDTELGIQNDFFIFQFRVTNFKRNFLFFNFELVTWSEIFTVKFLLFNLELVKFETET